MNVEQGPGSKLMRLSKELGQRLGMDFSALTPGWLSASEEQFEGGQGLG